jgi:hypothetical protein
MASPVRTDTGKVLTIPEVRSDVDAAAAPIVANVLAVLEDLATCHRPVSGLYAQETTHVTRAM